MESGPKIHVFGFSLGHVQACLTVCLLVQASYLRQVDVLGLLTSSDPDIRIPRT